MKYEKHDYKGFFVLEYKLKGYFKIMHNGLRFKTLKGAKQCIDAYQLSVFGDMPEEERLK